MGAGLADVLPAAQSEPPRRRRGLVLGVLLATGALVGGGIVLASGGSHRPAQLTGSDVLALARGAEGKMAALKSSKVDVTLSMSVSGHDLGGTGTGAFDYVKRDGSLSITIDPVGTLHEVMTPDGIYMQLPESERSAMEAQTGGKSWIEISFSSISKQAGVDLSSLMQQSGGQDPASSLRMLGEAGDFHLVGTESVRGVETTHYAGTVDIASVLRSKSTDSAATDRLLQQYSSTDVPVDMWLDADGVARRMSQTLPLKTPGTMKMTIEFYAFGTPVTVTVPPASDVFDAASLLGGGSGSLSEADATVRSDLRTMANEEETYFIDHQRYATAKQLAHYATLTLASDETVHIHLDGPGNGFCLVGAGPDSAVAVYGSEDGGIIRGATACPGRYPRDGGSLQMTASGVVGS